MVALGVVAAVVVVVVVVTAGRRLHGALHALQIVAADAENVVDGHLSALRARDGGHLVDGADAGLQPRQLRLRHQVRLVEDDAVRVRQLLQGLVGRVAVVALVQVARHVLGVHHRHNTVQAHDGAHVLVREGADDGRGVGQPCGLDHDVVKVLAAVLKQVKDHVDEVAAYGAAEAAVVEHHDGVLRVLRHGDELAVDVNLSKLVLDDGHPAAVVLGQQVV
mmetsp:Transcript_1817/g.4477  ORF Transcript_1817/g.4477 Transcript_1817/m.4477 type:complete len:220 (+) Transcript_1817:235-894(+)